MPGFNPVSSGIGAGFSVVIWLVVLAVVAGIVWRGRSGYVPAGIIVVALKRFRVNEDPSAELAVEISGRVSGIVSWVLNLLRLEPGVELIVTNSEVTFHRSSLSGLEHHYIPLGQIHATVCGYHRSILAFGFAILFSAGFLFNLLSGLFENNRNDVGSDMGLAFGFLILTAIAALVYFLSKKIFVSIETEQVRAVAFKRSAIENISVDLPEAMRAISVINARVLAAQTVTAGTDASVGARPSPTQSSATSPAGSVPGRCPRCSTVNPIDVRFCENCGCTLPA